MLPPLPSARAPQVVAAVDALLAAQGLPCAAKLASVERERRSKGARNKMRKSISKVGSAAAMAAKLYASMEEVHIERERIQVERVEHEAVALEQNEAVFLALHTHVQLLEQLEARVGGGRDERPGGGGVVASDCAAQQARSHVGGCRCGGRQRASHGA